MPSVTPDYYHLYQKYKNLYQNLQSSGSNNGNSPVLPINLFKNHQVLTKINLVRDSQGQQTLIQYFQIRNGSEVHFLDTNEHTLAVYYPKQRPFTVVFGDEALIWKVVGNHVGTN
jgi:hypothetical protein